MLNALLGSKNILILLFLLNCDDDEYSQGYSQNKEAFRALTQDDILNPYILDLDFVSSNMSNDIGCKIYVFEIRYQKNLEAAQPFKVEFKFSGFIATWI